MTVTKLSIGIFVILFTGCFARLSGQTPEPLTSGTPLSDTANPGYYAFDQQQGYWSVVGLRSTSDYDLSLTDGPPDFNPMAYSTERGNGKVDFIVVDHNHADT